MARGSSFLKTYSKKTKITPSWIYLLSGEEGIPLYFVCGIPVEGTSQYKRLPPNGGSTFFMPVSRRCNPNSSMA